LAAKFGPDLSKDLLNTWYTEAETLMDLSLPLTNTVHQNVIERLNIETKSKGCQWQWGRIASEFSESKNFDFALGAYSPIDKILEIAMSKDRTLLVPVSSTLIGRFSLTPRFAESYGITKNELLVSSFETPMARRLRFSSRKTIPEALLSTPRSC
jgi:hypothetical protein